MRYSYDAWGKCTTDLADTTGNGIHEINPFRYRGYYYDTGTGLYYLQSRYYDPKVGRFVNGDGYISTGFGFVGFNMYAYCNNSSVIYRDPYGNDAIILYYKSQTGHIGLLLQDQYYCWWYFYWGSGVTDRYTTILKSTKSFIVFDKLGYLHNVYDMTDYNDVYLALCYYDIFCNVESISYFNGLSDMLYIRGDFSKSYSYINSYITQGESSKNKRGMKKTKKDVKVMINGVFKDITIRQYKETSNTKYNLYTFNCMQFSLKALSCGNFQDGIASVISKYSGNVRIPNSAFPKLKLEILNLTQ